MIVIDTENGSASKYVGIDGFQFKVLKKNGKPLFNGVYNPEQLIAVLKSIGDQDLADVVIVDGVSPFWNSTGGFLEMIDDEVKRQKARGGKGDSFAAWKSVDPLYRKLVTTIQTSPFHCILTIRSKIEYQKTQEGGKTVVNKVGLKPEFRDQFEYEVDIEAQVDSDHNLIIGKHRLGKLLDGKIFNKPGKEFADILKEWLSTGEPAKPYAEPATPEPQATDNYDLALHQIQSASTVEELAEVKTQLTAFRDDGLVTSLQYQALGGEYMNRKKELTASV